MGIADFVVLAASLAATGGLAWFLFGSRKAHPAELTGTVRRG